MSNNNCLPTACQSLDEDPKRILITGANSYIGTSFENDDLPEVCEVITYNGINPSFFTIIFSEYLPFSLYISSLL